MISLTPAIFFKYALYQRSVAFYHISLTRVSKIKTVLFVVGYFSEEKTFSVHECKINLLTLESIYTTS